MIYHFLFTIFVLELSSFVTSSTPPIPENVSTVSEADLSKYRNMVCVTSHINSTIFQSLFTPSLRRLEKIFQKHGYEIRIVGGAVRDLLLGKVPHDLDFATPATPSQMKIMFKRERLPMINTNGEKHGTITPRIDKENYEITTLRKDAICDGRHAVVQFTTDWRVDAARRDLTVNALFLGFNGTLYDYFNGKEDLERRRIRFVGDAGTRIREDYLRILRYFRFFGRLARNPNDHEPEVLQAIAENKDGLSNVSGERIWMEFLRILTGRFSKEVVLKMLDLELGPLLGLPSENLDKECFELVCSLKVGYYFKPITYIAALLPNVEAVEKFNERCKLSKEEKELAIFLISHKKKDFVIDPHHVLRPFQHLLVTAHNKEQVKSFILELIKFKDMGQEVLRQFESWDFPKFPIEVPLLRQKGLQYGRQIGFVLTGLKKYWVEKNFNVTEDELLDLVPKLLFEFKQTSFSATVDGRNTTS